MSFPADLRFYIIFGTENICFLKWPFRKYETDFFEPYWVLSLSLFLLYTYTLVSLQIILYTSLLFYLFDFHCFVVLAK